MIRKTEAIVLRSLPYGDNALITQLYTREQGIKSFIARISRKPGAKIRSALFQPLQQIEIVYFQKAGRDLQYLSESRLIHYYRHLDQDPIAISIACYLLEIVRSCLKEEEGNEALFLFLQDSLQAMDAAEEGRVQLLIWFLLHFTGYLGFSPSVAAGIQSDKIYFDIEAGRVEENTLQYDRTSHLVLQFIDCEAAHCQKIPLSSKDKNDILNRLMLYYRYHIEGFRQPGSPEVLVEVFRG
jgi:DNA repair protein RecO (recombination protein O)